MLTFKYCTYISFLLFPMLASYVQAEQLSSSIEVQANIKILRETKSCSQCNLSGADLNRFDLSDANLEGANLSRARLSLTNLSGANLRNADLRETVFNGADLGDADLRGADLTGASLVGAYLGGTVMDGEMVTTTPPDAVDEISAVEEIVSIEDTVHSKAPQETEEMTIAARRDFEETPPAVPVENTVLDDVKKISPIGPVGDVALSYEDEEQIPLPPQSVAAPDSKTVPAIQKVQINEEDTVSEEVIAEKATEVTKETIEITEPVTPVKPVESVEPPKAIAGAETTTKNPSDLSDLSDLSEKEQGATTNDKAGIDEEKALASMDNEPVKAEDTAEIEESEGIVQSMLNIFSSSEEGEPLTEISQNIIRLLNTNQCYGCVLSGVDLSDENLDGADLESADLSNAILRNVDFEGANLKGANLSGADLSGADLTDADLYSADLSGANVTDANLEGIFLDEVNLSGIKGYNQQNMPSVLLLDNAE